MKYSNATLSMPRSSQGRVLTRPSGGFVRSLASAMFVAGLSAASLLHAAVVPQPFTFTAPTYVTTQGATSIKVTVTRPIATAAQDVTINTNDGTSNAWPPFEAALAGTDFTDLAGAGTTLNFPIGTKTKVVSIPLTALTGTVANKRFSATISDPTNGATLGAVTTAEIQILSKDTTKPVLIVDSPSATDTSLDAVENSEVVVEGSVQDVNGVAKVTVNLNGGTATLATIGQPVGSTVPFSLTVAPKLGTNVLVTTAYDLKGNKSIITRTFALTGGADLTMSRTAYSGKRVDTVGSIALSVTPTQAATTVTPSAASANPKACKIIPGKLVRLTANSVTGSVFSSWTTSGLPEAAKVVGNIVEFYMPETAVAVNAVFVANVFAPPVSGMSTIFNGHTHPLGGASTKANEGFVTVNVNSTTGAFTGQASIDGVTQAITGKMFGNGDTSFTVGTNVQHYIAVGSRYLVLSYDFDEHSYVQARFFDAEDNIVSSGWADRCYYSATRKVGSTLLNSASSGSYNFVIPAKDQVDSGGDPVDTHTYPQGYGFGSFTLSNLGTVTFSGTLADGTAFSGTSNVAWGNEIPLYALLTTPGASTKNGVLTGTLYLSPFSSDTDVVGTNLLWIRPASAVALYTSGWPNGIKVDLAGTKYNKAKTASAVLVTPAKNISLGNAYLQFNDGKLVANSDPELVSISYTAFNIDGNTVTKNSATDFTTTLSCATGGAFVGTFTPNWSSPAATKPAFKGILLDKGANHAGFGFFLSNAVGDTDPESGSVALGAQDTP